MGATADIKSATKHVLICDSCSGLYALVRSGKSRMCQKCQRRKRSAANRRRRRAWAIISSARSRARKLGIAFDLCEHADALDRRLRVGVCELTGVRLDFTHVQAEWNSPSLDRIDPAGPYVYENVRVVCWWINRALANRGEAIFREIAEGYCNQRRLETGCYAASGSLLYM